jgi:hypothetical protein
MAEDRDHSTDFAEGLPPVLPPTAPPTANEPTIMQIIIAWEKLRFFYNIWMFVIYLIFFVKLVRRAGNLPSAEGVCGVGVVFFLIVNVPFCLCHVFEVYLCWLGMRRGVARFGIFVIVTGTIGGGLMSLLFLK